MANPPYVDLPGSRTYQQPFICTGWKAQNFVLAASHDQLEKMVDSYLNVIPDSPFRYAPLTASVNVCTMSIDKITCANPPDANMGWMRESDFNFNIALAAFRGEKFDHIAFAFPFLLVDSPVTLVSGREIWGYRKSWGLLEYVPGTYQPVAARTWVLKTYEPSTQLTLAEVARVIPPPAPGESREAKWEDLLKLTELAAEDLALDVGVGVDHLIEHFKSEQVLLAFLLQLRSVADPKTAAYQALIEAPMLITNVRSSKVLPEGYTIKLTDYASYPLISNLGITVDANGVAKVELAMEVDFDATLANGTVI